MEQKDIIDRLFYETSNYNNSLQAEMAAALLNTVAADIYSESQRFVFELIQNADDAAIGDSNEVYFNFLSGALIVSHNGNPFDEADIKSLTTAGSSTKKADPNKTGYKGIGFKSVFGMSKRVTIFSNGFQFRFDKAAHQNILPWQVIPIWTELSDLPENISDKLAEAGYKVSTVLELNAKSLEKDLIELISNGHILLFLRRVTKISISRNGKPDYVIEKKIISTEASYNEINLLEGEKIISTWILKTFEKIPVSEQTRLSLQQDEKTPEKLKSAKFTEISFAAKVENGKIKPLKNEDSLIFTYLPTKVHDFGFPFLVNSSFMTNAARESINSDIVWNQWLFSLVAEKIFDWLSELSISNYKFQVLHLLPTKFGSTNNDLKRAFNESYLKNCQKQAFINTELESVKKPSEVIYDLTGLSLQSFINPKSITEFFETDSGLIYPEDCFVNSKMEETNRLRALSVATFKLEKLEKFFTSQFFKSRHSISENFSLIKYFMEMSEKDAAGEWFQTAKTLPFIYDENGVLYNPSFGICFPSEVGQNSTELGNIPIIHNEVFAKIQGDIVVFNWLKKLGVQHPSEAAYVTNVIVPGLREPGFINESNYLKITFYLLKLYGERAISAEVLESLRELPLKIKSANEEFVQAQHCYLSNRFSPLLQLEGVISDVSFVSDAYLSNGISGNEWNLFFKAIKVKDSIEIETINSNNTLETLKDVTDSLWVDISDKSARSVAGAFGFGSHNVIGLVKLPSFLNITVNNFDYCKIFWKNLLEGPSSIFNELNTPARFKYGVGYGLNSHVHQVENYFPWFVRNKKCIPTTLGTLYKSTDVYINTKETKEIGGNYFPVFDYDDNITDDWKGLLGFKNKLEIKDYLFILETIVIQAEADPGNKPPITRIGLIYNKLASLLPDLSRDWKDYITTWAKTNRLYATNEKFENAIDLKIITIEGFVNESESLKVIYLPSNCKKENANFRELLALLQVQTIDKFDPNFHNKQNEQTFKNKLENILPFFVAVIEKKNPDEYTNQYGRLYQVIDNTTFFTADEITLSFDYMGEQIAGPTLTVFRENSYFYFKGKWSAERTLLSLIKELSNYIEVFGFNEELGFLLRENDSHEILEWIKELGILESSLQPKKIFRQQMEEINIPEEKHTPPNEYSESSFEYQSVSEPEKQPEIPFVPKYTPSAFDMKGISFQKSNPSEQAVQIKYTEISSQETREEIGLWTEDFVYRFLCENSGIYSEIIWENKSGESGKPYDFRVVENGVEKFIDVKGTPSPNKNLVYLSVNEWLFMLEKEERYSIMRVYDVNSEKPRIVEFENIKESIMKGVIIPDSTSIHLSN